MATWTDDHYLEIFMWISIHDKKHKYSKLTNTKKTGRNGITHFPRDEAWWGAISQLPKTCTNVKEKIV